VDAEYWFRVIIIGAMGLSVGIALAPEGLWVLLIFLTIIGVLLYTVWERRDMLRSEPDIEDV